MNEGLVFEDFDGSMFENAVIAWYLCDIGAIKTIDAVLHSNRFIIKIKLVNLEERAVGGRRVVLGCFY